MKPQSEIDAKYDSEVGLFSFNTREPLEYKGKSYASGNNVIKQFIHALRQEDLRAVRGMVEEAKITQRPLGWLNDDMVEGYNQALSYILSKLPE